MQCAYRDEVVGGRLRQEALKRILSALHRHRIRVLVLKGAYLGAVIYPDPALRWMIDLDLLIQPADLTRAAGVLTQDGFSAAARVPGTAETEALHLPPFVKAGMPGVELHHRLMLTDSRELLQEIWDRAVTAPIAGLEAETLSPEDLLLHLSVHASSSHGFGLGLRPLCDIAETIRHFGSALDWDVVVERARRWRWQRGAALSMRTAKDLLGAAVPDGALHRLWPQGFDAALVDAARGLALGSPDMHRVVNNPAVGTMWMAPTRWGRARQMVRQLLLPRTVIAARYGVSPASPRLPFYYAARLRYLLARHGSMAWQSMRDDPGFAPTADRLALLRRWLEEEE
jgi:hypothetical protein